jgi:hypothetical protein
MLESGQVMAKERARKRRKLIIHLQEEKLGGLIVE